MEGLVRIDGKVYRYMGADRRNKVPAINQTGIEVLPTRTIYSFAGSGIDLTLTFLTPALPQDLDLMSRPVTYLTWTAKSNDGKQHDVNLYFDTSTEIAANTADEPTPGAGTVLAIWMCYAPVRNSSRYLQKSGDNLRIDWGYLYVAAGRDQQASLAGHHASRPELSFRAPAICPTGRHTIDTSQRFKTPVLAAGFDLGSVTPRPYPAT